jgi:hypothetical protein
VAINERSLRASKFSLRALWAGLGFADDSFQVLLAHELEELRSVTVQVLHVQQVRVVRRMTRCPLRQRRT